MIHSCNRWRSSAAPVLVSMLLALTFGASEARSETLTVTFEDMPWHNCGDQWTMSGLPMRLLPLSSSCLAYRTNYGWYLGSACLEIDVSALGDLGSVALEILNYDAPGKAYLFLMDAQVPLLADYSRASGVAEWLQVANPDLPVTRLRLFHGRGLLQQAVFEYGALSSESTTWGRVKALYR
jgi:hypothetical protein